MKKLFSLLFFTLVAAGMYAQDNWQVSGVVTDANDGSELIGVSVSVQGTSQGTVTDLDGRYSISVPKGKSLTFSYVGYKPQTIVVKGSTLDVALNTDTKMLDEVVAIGYGSIKKSDLTGAVGSISGEKLRQAPVAKLDQALQGRMAGVTVNSNSGQPGAAATVMIRGIGTVSNAKPIFVVDGLITDNINFLSTSDIASLEVLKDASAQAIYGSRGANGVVLITTKKGDASGKTNLTFETYYGVQNRWKKLDVMGRDELVTTIATLGRTKKELDEVGLNEWIRSNKTPNTGTYYPRIVEYNADGTVKTPGIDYTMYDTDWQDEVFVKDAPIQNYYFSADGGNDKMSYMMSVNYFDQKGILINSYYNRLTLRLNTSYKMRDWLRIGENLSFSNTRDNGVQGNGNTALIASALSMAPWDPVKYPAGTLSGYNRNKPEEQRDLGGRYSTPTLFKNVANPFVQVYNAKPNPDNIDWVGDVYAEITPVKGLILRGDIYMKFWNGMNRTYLPTYDALFNGISKNSISSWMERQKQMTYEGTATYNKVFNKKHDLTVMVGITREDWDQYRVNASGMELENTAEKNWYIGQTPEAIRQNPDGSYYSTRSGGDAVDKISMLSYLGRIHYVFDNKYLLTSNLRRDASSKLYFPGMKFYDVFPSVAAAWKVSEESFFEPYLNTIDFLKVRAGWGRLGNANSLGSSTLAESVERSTLWMMGYPLENPNAMHEGMSSLKIPAKTHWEYTQQTDFGIDLSLWRGLFYANIDLFRRDTYDMIMGIPNPAHVGLRYKTVGNASTVRNQGIEFSLEHRHKIGDVSYSVAGNVSFIHNELKALKEGEPLWEGIILSDEGIPLRTIWVLEYDGVFQNQAEVDAHSWTNPATGQKKLIQPDAKPGDARYVDRNHDGIISELDRFNAGNPFPSVTYGFNASVDYKGFDFQVFFQGIGGNEVYNWLRQNKLESDGTTAVLSTDMKNVFYAVRENPADLTSAWVNGMEGSNGSIPNPSESGSVHNKDASSRFVEKASYLRLKNIQLGYTLPKDLTQKIGVERLRFYVGGSNLLTFTKYTGFDPEMGDNGQDWGNFPQARTVLFGLNMNF
ncbi:MAG: TonB-dependent receptor [Dysgonamonadaceae bacterium]|jgi:TonB-linked SusC/RagA family outer membrane protein|nr:TonB-dependent receptor [Dysgonamonadaceae bacterium]